MASLALVHPVPTARRSQPAPTGLSQLPTPSDAPPVVVVHRAGHPAPLRRAADLARRSGAVLHVVHADPVRLAPWARPAAVTGAAATRAALVERRLGGRDLHVEVHAAASRPDRLAREIAVTTGGVVVR